MVQRARAVSLRLPGQSLRAHHDYQGRLLTDAVLTAIAVRSPSPMPSWRGCSPFFGMTRQSGCGTWLWL